MGDFSIDWCGIWMPIVIENEFGHFDIEQA